MCLLHDESKCCRIPAILQVEVANRTPGLSLRRGAKDDTGAPYEDRVLGDAIHDKFAQGKGPDL